MEGGVLVEDNLSGAIHGFISSMTVRGWGDEGEVLARGEPGLPNRATEIVATVAAIRHAPVSGFPSDLYLPVEE